MFYNIYMRLTGSRKTLLKQGISLFNRQPHSAASVKSS